MSTITPRDTVPDQTPAANTEPNAESAASTATPVASGSPFSDEREVLYDPQAIRDELSQAQSSPTAARKLSARHFARLIYSLQYEPGVVERHIAPYTPFNE
jgi:hypothetical protein